MSTNTNLGRPIRPDEVTTTYGRPEFVYNIVNDLLHAGQREIFQRVIVEKINEMRGDREFQWSWLDFEDDYRADGWIVTYNRPGYDDDFPATFTFSVKKQ